MASASAYLRAHAALHSTGRAGDRLRDLEEEDEEDPGLGLRRLGEVERCLGGRYLSMDACLGGASSELMLLW
jgi:hypothetical protein